MLCYTPGTEATILSQAPLCKHDILCVLMHLCEAKILATVIEGHLEYPTPKKAVFKQTHNLLNRQFDWADFQQTKLFRISPIN